MVVNEPDEKRPVPNAGQPDSYAGVGKERLEQLLEINIENAENHKAMFNQYAGVIRFIEELLVEIEIVVGILAETCWVTEEPKSPSSMTVNSTVYVFAE